MQQSATLAGKRQGASTKPTTCTRWQQVNAPATAREPVGQRLAEQLQREKAIMGVFDEGCMGMFNAIIPDHLLNPTGVFKERLSQSALYYETTQVTDDEAHGRAPVDGRSRHEVHHRPERSRAI